MRQCRICLDTENPETMVAPCRCRGTAEFIHTTCLEEYLRYYPNNRCTVCHGTLRHMSREDTILLGCLIVVCSLFLYLSTSVFAFKFFIFTSLGISLYNYTIYSMMTTDMSLLSMLFLFGLGVAPTYLFYTAMVIAFVGFLCLYAFVVLIPPQFIFTFVVTLFCGLYAFLIMISIQDITDTYGAALVFCILFLAWHTWLRYARRIRV